MYKSAILPSCESCHIYCYISPDSRRNTKICLYCYRSWSSILASVIFSSAVTWLQSVFSMNNSMAVVFCNERSSLVNRRHESKRTNKLTTSSHRFSIEIDVTVFSNFSFLELSCSSLLPCQLLTSKFTMWCQSPSTGNCFICNNLYLELMLCPVMCLWISVCFRV